MMAFADYNKRPDSRLSLNQQQQSHQPAPLRIDHADLDDSIIDSAMNSAIDRRDSFANSSATIFSPQSTTWEEDFSAPALDRTHSLSSNPFFEQNNNPFTRLDRPQVATFGQQSTWPLVDRTADSRAQFGSQPHDAFTAGDIEPGPQGYMTVGSSAGTYNGVPMSSNVRPSSVFPPSSQGIDTPLPHSPEKWNSINGQEMDPRPLPKRMRQNSPPRSFSPGFPRRDGIRKKNARFEIPVERNLMTIDQMIQDATNDDEVKELKQQKRLLRNRQAALDSRQRKKKHTEELEEEKKQWNERYSMLETELESLRMATDQHALDRAQWEEQAFQQQQQIQTLMYEKEDLVAKHTLETGELRKKLNFLAEKLDAKGSGPATVTPSSTEFTDFAADMNGLTMDNEEWNNYIFVDPLFSAEQDGAQQQSQHPPHQPTQQTSSLVVPTRPKQQQLISDADKPVASGLLFMLLLCGAFVASKSSGTHTPSMPRMPDDVRAASATVLDNIFKDAGVAPGSSSNAARQLIASSVHALEPGPSGVPSASAWQPGHKTTLSGAEFASISQPSMGTGLGIGGNLEQMHHGLVMPSKEQEAEQLFGMTPAQYNSLTNTEFNRPAYSMAANSDTPPMSEDDGSSPMSGRKNLAQTLQRMRDESMGDSAAEVYTRSLLWDRAPTDIVKEFKRMVEESNIASGGEHAVKSEA